MGKRRVLVSVTDKTGIVDFCSELAGLGYEIVSTGGTLRALTDGGVPAVQVAEITSMPEILGGRVKTLHPAVFAGILARREVAGDIETLAEHGIEAIDVVAVNLYPFAQTVANPKAGDEEIIEQIDIGGPSLLRAAAKNHRDVSMSSSIRPIIRPWSTRCARAAGPTTAPCAAAWPKKSSDTRCATTR
jgi:phosphoribosylaminoimidazolecarboxamide formyltransferase/IMP cyclohydrolase